MTRFTKTLRACGYRPQTAQRYGEMVVTYLNRVSLNGEEPEPFERSAVIDYLADVAERLSPSTLVTYHKVLRGFFEWAAGEGVAPNPMLGLRQPRLSTEQAERRAPVYTEADRDALLTACPDSWLGLRNRALILTLWHTPLRASEVARLLVTDVEWSAGDVVVRRGKGGAEYVVPVPPAVLVTIRRYLAVRAHDTAALWLERDGRMLTPRALALMLRRTGERAGIGKPVYAHAFRHRFRERCAMEGVPETITAKLMGLKSTKVLDRTYARTRVRDGAVEYYRRHVLARDGVQDEKAPRSLGVARPAAVVAAADAQHQLAHHRLDQRGPRLAADYRGGRR